MFRTICDMIPLDRDLPARARNLDILQRILENRLYDNLPYEFHEERTAGGEYIPLRLRRPSVRYALARIVVEDSVALLFSEGHFPAIDSPDIQARDVVAALARSTHLNAVMTDAALRGSVGSVAILLRVLRRRPFLQVLTTNYLTPFWDPAAPDTLTRVTERFKVRGAELVAQGYDGVDPDQIYWFSRSWDDTSETWFLPSAVGQDTNQVIDQQRSVRHSFGFVPIVWIKNLPGGSATDGMCTFSAAIDTSIEIDYQLSQAGRGLKYSSDPTLLIREPAGLDGRLVRGAADALVVSEKGDAKLLEIGGTASHAVIEYVRILRELALENVHGNRADASKLTTPASGRALEMMNQGLLWLADNLRISYGDAGMLAVAGMMLKAHGIMPLTVDGVQLPEVSGAPKLSLRWPEWYPADSIDRQRDAQTVIGLVQAKQLSRATAMHILGQNYNIADTSDELSRIKAEANA